MPFLLNTGRTRDQWHTMTRTGLVPALMAHAPEPLLAMHPADAARTGLGQDDLARVETAHGSALLRVDLRHTQRHGELFAPMHWTDAFGTSGPVGRAVTASRDAHSGQPELKATPARVVPVPVHFHGLLLRRAGGSLTQTRDQPPFLYWTRIPLSKGQLYRIAGLGPLPHTDALDRLAAMLLAAPADAERLEVADPKRGVLRAAALVDGALECCLFLARDRAALPKEEVISASLGGPVPDSLRYRLLAGLARDGAAEEGPRVCACFGVGRDAIRHAVVTHRLRNTAEIGRALRAGTNCGSCIPELEEILRDVRAPAG
jgi:assimilatory nitrate reductase catalytic subunit